MKRRVSERDITIMIAIDELYKSLESVGALRLNPSKGEQLIEVQMIEKTLSGVSLIFKWRKEVLRTTRMN